MKRILILLVLIALAAVPASAADQMLPITSCEWYSSGFVGEEVDGHGIGLACDNNTATYAQHTNSSNTGNLRVKFSVWGGDQVKQCQWYPQNYASHWTFANSTTNNTALMYSAGVDVYNSWTTNKTTNDTHKTFYLGSYTWPINLAEIRCFGTADPIPIVDFMGAPLNATAPAYVAFTDLSQNERGTCTYNWSFTPTDGVLAAPQDLDNEDITMLFTENGNFTITHGVSCDGGSNTSTKTDYIHIFNSTALSTFRVRAVDAISGYGVNGAQVDVFDIENTSWTNQTSVTGEVTLSALTGHNINAYGSATGYDDGESLALPVVANSLYPIYMWPTNMGTNVSAGNLTLYVTVLEEGTNTRLTGYSLTVFAPFGVYYSGTTNENGIFQTVIANKTDYNIEVGPQKGHLGAQKIFNSGTQVGGGDAYVEQTIWLPLSTVTTAPTVTTLPGGGTPTTVQTVDPYPCVGDGSYQDTLNCQRKQGEMGADIIKWGPDLVLFFIMLTFLGGFALIWKMMK